MKKITTLLFFNCIVLALTAQIPMENISETGIPQEGDISIPGDYVHEPKPGNSMLHATQTTKHRMDSITVESYDVNAMEWAIDYKWEYGFDNQENSILQASYLWDETIGQWRPASSRESAYDTNGNEMFESYQYSWNSGQWGNGYKHENTYDANNNQILRVWYDWDGNQWIQDRKGESTYDTNNNQTLWIRYSWDGNQWIQIYKDEITYDANNNETLRIWYGWDGSQWIENDKYEYTYDAGNNKILSIYYDWDGSQWIENDKFEYDYDANNNQILALDYDWDGSQWIEDNKSEAAFNANNGLLFYANYSWDALVEEWVGMSKSEYTYDANDNYVLFNRYLWNSSTIQWENDYRYSYSYDNSFPYDELITPFSEPYFQHKRTEFTLDNWDDTTEQWVQDQRGIYHYSEQPVGIENVAAAGIGVFPNPAKDYVVFDLKNNAQLARIELYDAQGRLADVQSLNNNKISVKNLNSGVYFYQLIHGTEQNGGRLIVK